MDPLKIKLLNQHSKYLSRRDFISLGLTAAGGVAFAPTLFHSLKRAQAFAAGLPAVNNQMVPFITFDLAGGAALPGNFLVGGAGGALDLLPSYSKLGWNPRSGTDNRFGLPMAKADVSQILNGMLSVMSPEAQANFRFASVLHTSRDDTGDNPLSVAHLVSSAGLVGQNISSGVGTSESASAGNSRSVKEIPEFTCRYISKLKDLTEANAASNVLKSQGKGFLSKVFSQVHSLSSMQAKTLLSQNGTPELLKTFDERLSGAEVLAMTPSDVDPRTNPLAAKVYELNSDSDESATTSIRAGLVFGALSRATGPAVITIGGCDYHDSTQTSGDSKDKEIGVEIGRAIELAHLMKTPLFIHIITDGGVAAFPDDRSWVNDSGEKSMSLMGVYHPEHVPRYLDQSRVQIGAYTAGQGADRSTFFGASPALAGYVTFVNYLSVCNRLGEFDTLAGRVINSGDLKNVLVFGS